MRRGLVGAMMVLVLAALSAGTASAQAVAPGAGNAFGQHVAGMAPEHARLHGEMFGRCVSTMARTGTCPYMP